MRQKVNHVDIFLNSTVLHDDVMYIVEVGDGGKKDMADEQITFLEHCYSFIYVYLDTRSVIRIQRIRSRVVFTKNYRRFLLEVFFISDKMLKLIICTAVVAILLSYMLQFEDYTYTFEETIKADFKTVCDFRSDFRNLVQVHPFVNKVELLERSTEGEYTVLTYDVQEEMPGFHFNFSYDSCVLKWCREGKKFNVNIVAMVLRGARLETDYLIYELEPQIVKVEQTSKLSMPRILSYSVNPVFVDAQISIGQRIKELLEKK